METEQALLLVIEAQKKQLASQEEEIARLWATLTPLLHASASSSSTSATSDNKALSDKRSAAGKKGAEAKKIKNYKYAQLVINEPLEYTGIDCAMCGLAIEPGTSNFYRHKIREQEWKYNHEHCPPTDRMKAKVLPPKDQAPKTASTQSIVELTKESTDDDDDDLIFKSEDYN